MNILQNIQTFLSGQQVDAAFITEPHNILYATGFDSNPHERIFGLMVFQTAEPFLICPFMEVEDAKNAGWTYEVIGHQDHENPWLLIKEAVESRGINVQSMAIEQMHLTVDRYQYLQEIFPAAQYSRIDEHLQQMRNIKNDSELALLRKAAELADQAIEIGIREIKEGKTETEVIVAVESQILSMGAEKMSFETMVLSGPKTASPHGKPGDRAFQQGDFILFDLGVVYKGYCSDITRTVVLGEPTESMREIYETVRRAEQAAIDIVKPGIAAKDVDITARTIIEDAGYGEYFTHRIGHGLGISVHEFPSITNTNELSLEEGMVFTIEPGIYVPGVGGVRIEDDVVVTKDGVEVLTKSPKELRII